jgi:hypothetical protein
MSNVFTFDDEDQTPFSEEPTEQEPDGQKTPEEGETGNRPFIIGAIVLGVILLCTLVLGAVYALMILPGQQAARLNAQGTLDSVNAEAATAVAATAEVMAYTPTLPPTDVPTPIPTATPLLMNLPSETPGVGGAAAPQDANGIATATAVAELNALNTQLANSQLTATLLPSATALSNTGFADEVGLPGLFVAALVLVAVILLARRMREIPVKSR